MESKNFLQLKLKKKKPFSQSKIKKNLFLSEILILI